MPRWNADNMQPLARIRSNAGFSREKAAAMLSITAGTLNRYETGGNDIPLGIAEKMSELYSVDFDAIRTAARETRNVF